MCDVTSFAAVFVDDISVPMVVQFTVFASFTAAGVDFVFVEFIIGLALLGFSGRVNCQSHCEGFL